MCLNIIRKALCAFGVDYANVMSISRLEILYYAYYETVQVAGLSLRGEINAWRIC